MQVWLSAAAAFCLSAAGAIAQVPDYPSPLTREFVEDWVIECYTDPPLPGQCQVYQRILADNNTRVAMVATMAADADGTIWAQIAFPLGIDIESGARFSVGAGYAARAPITRCTIQGCLLEGQLSPELIGQLRAASTASVTVLDGEGQEFQIPISLAGFSSALSQLIAIEAGEERTGAGASGAEQASDPSALERGPETSDSAGRDLGLELEGQTGLPRDRLIESTGAGRPAPPAPGAAGTGGE